MANSNSGEPSTAPQPNRWYELRLGSSCRHTSPTAKYCTLRYEFKPASIDKTQAGSLQKSKDNRVSVEFHNNQPGKPKVAFEGNQEEYKDNDGVLFFDGETFRLERLHRAVKRLRHVRVPGESATNSSAATTTGMGESHSPPSAKVVKPAMNKPSIHSVPVEVERIDIGEPENAEPRNNNRSSTYQPVTADPFSFSSDPDDQDENLDILGDDDNGSPNNMASAQGTSYRGFDINIPNQLDMDDEVADVDVNDEADEGLNAAEALRAQVSAEGQQVEQASSSSSGSSSSSSSSGSGSGSGSGSSSSDSDGSDGDSASSGGDVDI